MTNPAAEPVAGGEALPSPMLPADPILDAAPEAAIEPIAPGSDPDVTAEPAADGDMALAGLVALLAIAALGGAGFMLMRRRKPAYDREPEMVLTQAQAMELEPMEPNRPVYARPVAQSEQSVRAPVTPAYRAPTSAGARPSTASRDANGKPVSPFIYNPIYQGKRAEERPVFTMPAGPVPIGERRTALLSQMVASRPDAANPFTSPKWRMRRARSLIGKREAMLRDQATRPFDFRDFSTHVPIKPYRPIKTNVPHMA